MAWGFALVKRSLCSRECLFRKMCLHFNLTFAYFGYSSKKHVQLFSFKASYKFAVWHDIIYPNAESDLQKNGRHNQLAHVVEPVTFRSAALFSPLQATAAPRPPVTDSHCWNDFFRYTCGESFMFSGKSYFLICEIIKSNQINYGKGFNKSFIVWDDNDSDQIWATETLMSCCASHTQPGVCAPRRHMEALEFSSLTWPSCLRLQICPNLIGFWLHLRQLLRSVSQPNAPLFFFFFFYKMTTGLNIFQL